MWTSVQHKPQVSVRIFDTEFLNIKLILQLSNTFTVYAGHLQTDIAIAFSVQTVLIQTRNKMTVNYSTHFLFSIKHIYKIINQSIKINTPSFAKNVHNAFHLQKQSNQDEKVHLVSLSFHKLSQTEGSS